MAKVTNPLLSGDASGDFGKKIVFRKGGTVTRYHKPRNPRSPAQVAHRQAFKEYYMSALTQAAADLLYAALEHLHDDRYSLIDHEHDHGGLNGLADDDHQQYFNQTRGDARYLREAFPVGSIYTSVLSTNPATLLGYGTWTSFAAGRVLVGRDASQTEFDTVEETGGEKTHTLTNNESPGHAHPISTYFYGTGNGSHISAAQGGIVTGAGSNDSSTASGGGEPHNNLQPYIVVYMWKRTA